MAITGRRHAIMVEKKEVNLKALSSDQYSSVSCFFILLSNGALEEIDAASVSALSSISCGFFFEFLLFFGFHRLFSAFKKGTNWDAHQ
jgi:hypothetical protein